MPWCPECGTEYRKGFTQCKDCRIPLGDKMPVPKSEFVDSEQVRETLLTIVRDEVEFTRIESLMGEAGIPVLKKHHGSGEYLELYMGTSPYGIEIYVPYEAHSRAKALLSGEEPLDGDSEQGSEISISPNIDDFNSKTDPLLDADEAQELQRYLNAVNQDMYRRKQVIAGTMLISIGAGLIWTVFSILRELF